MSPSLSLNKFFVFSGLLHLALFGAGAFFVVETVIQKPIPVEISFGLGDSRGGSSPKAHIQPAPKKVATAPKAIAPNTNAVVQTTSTPTESVASTAAVAGSSISSGHGLGTGSGDGTGTTSGSGAGFNDPKIKYRGQVYQLVNKNKKYPRKAKALQQEGTVVARIQLSKEGKLLKAEIVESSNYKSLAEATLEAIQKVKKFPTIPKEYGKEEVTLRIPFKFFIADGDF